MSLLGFEALGRKALGESFSTIIGSTSTVSPKTTTAAVRSAGKITAISSTTTTATPTRLITRIKVLAISAASATVKAIAVSKRVAISATSATVKAIAASRHLAIAGSTVTAAIKSVNRLLAVSATSVTAAIKSAGKPVVIPATSSTASVRMTGKPVAISSVTATAETGLINRLKVLAISATSATASARRAIKQAMVTATTATVMARAVNRLVSLLIAATSTTTTSKSSLKQFASNVGSSVSASRIVLGLRNIGVATAITRAVMVRKLGTIAAVTVAGAGLTCMMVLAVAASITVTVVAGAVATVTWLLALSVSVASTAVLQTKSTFYRAFATWLEVAPIEAQLQTRIMLLTSTTTSVAPSRTVGKIFRLAVASASLFAVAVHVMRSAVLSITISRLHRLAITRSVAASISPSAFKAATRHIAVMVTVSIAALTPRNVLQFASVTLSTGVSAVRRIRKVAQAFVHGTVAVNLISQFVRYARRLLGRAGEAIIVGMASLASIIGRPDPVAGISGPVQIVGVAVRGEITGNLIMTNHDPIDFICGDSWELTGPLLDGNGNPMNMTGASVSWKLDTIDGATTVNEKHIGSGITVLDANAATILIVVPDTETVLIPPANYRDWLRITLGDGSVFTEWTGVIRAGANPT